MLFRKLQQKIWWAAIPGPVRGMIKEGVAVCMLVVVGDDKVSCLRLSKTCRRSEIHL